jgi:hypothetical protein
MAEGAAGDAGGLGGAGEAEESRDLESDKGQVAGALAFQCFGRLQGLAVASLEIEVSHDAVCGFHVRGGHVLGNSSGAGVADRSPGGVDRAGRGLTLSRCDGSP